jgi:hemerythrin-like domain-containing protein
MPEEITNLESPIDVMYPLHKALRREAAQVEAAARQLAPEGNCEDFAAQVTRWATALEYHAVMEDTYMTAPLDRPSARTNEVEHQQLTVLLADLQSAVGEATEPTAVTPRALRHMLGKVVALRVAQDDHLEEEEERVLPIIRQHVSEAQQCEMVRRLLMDQKAHNPRWVLDWLAPYVTATEWRLLDDLTTRVEGA